MKVVLAIPCFNCEKQIVRVLGKIDEELLSLVDKVIILDNQSSDHTVEAAKSFLQNACSLFNKKTKLLVNEHNYGLGGSFKTLVKFASNINADYLALLHGDDQASLKDLKSMLKKLSDTDGPYDVIFGARFAKDSTLENYSLVREWGNKALNSLFSLFLNERVYDIGSGLNIYKMESMPLDEIKSWPNHIAFDVNLLLHFCSGKFNVLFHPIYWEDEDQISNAKNIATGLTVLKMLLHWKFGRVEAAEKYELEMTYDEVWP